MPQHIAALARPRAPVDRTLALLDTILLAAHKQKILANQEQYLTRTLQSRLADVEDAIDSVLHSIKLTVDACPTATDLQRLDLSSDLMGEFCRLETAVVDFEGVICNFSKCFSHHFQVLSEYRIHLLKIPHVVHQCNAADAVTITEAEAARVVSVLDNLMPAIIVSELAIHRVQQFDFRLWRLQQSIKGPPFRLTRIQLGVSSVVDVENASVRDCVSGATYAQCIEHHLGDAKAQLLLLLDDLEKYEDWEHSRDRIGPCLSDLATEIEDYILLAHTQCNRIWTTGSD